jgi:hypothetical protein
MDGGPNFSCHDQSFYLHKRFPVIAGSNTSRFTPGTASERCVRRGLGISPYRAPTFTKRLLAALTPMGPSASGDNCDGASLSSLRDMTSTSLSSLHATSSSSLERTVTTDRRDFAVDGRVLGDRRTSRFGDEDKGRSEPELACCRSSCSGNGSDGERARPDSALGCGGLGCASSTWSWSASPRGRFASALAVFNARRDARSAMAARRSACRWRFAFSCRMRRDSRSDDS